MTLIFYFNQLNKLSKLFSTSLLMILLIILLLIIIAKDIYHEINYLF